MEHLEYIKYTKPENCELGFTKDVWQNLNLEQRINLVILKADKIAKKAGIGLSSKFFNNLFNRLSTPSNGTVFSQPRGPKAILSLDSITSGSGLDNLMLLNVEMACQRCLIENKFHPIFWTKLSTEFKRYLAGYIMSEQYQEELMYYLSLHNPIGNFARKTSTTAVASLIKSYGNNFSAEELDEAQTHTLYINDTIQKLNYILPLHTQDIKNIYLYNYMLVHPQKYKHETIVAYEGIVTETLMRAFPNPPKQKPEPEQERE